MWHGPLFLQVFASHLLSTYSHIAVPKLGSEDQGHKGAMALAAAAVSGFFQLCMFHLKGCSSLNAPST